MNKFEHLYDKLTDLSRSYRWTHFANFEELLGKTLIAIEGAEVENDIILFTCSDGSEYIMYHEQDCCESVSIEDIDNDVSVLLNTPLTMAEVVSNSDLDENNDGPRSSWDESYTWTYYKLATVKGYVTIRWYGESNGYYSESVDVVKIK